jgi:hypothetical protein
MPLVWKLNFVAGALMGVLWLISYLPYIRNRKPVLYVVKVKR